MLFKPNSNLPSINRGRKITQNRTNKKFEENQDNFPFPHPTSAFYLPVCRAKKALIGVKAKLMLFCLQTDDSSYSIIRECFEHLLRARYQVWGYAFTCQCIMELLLLHCFLSLEQNVQLSQSKSTPFMNTREWVSIWVKPWLPQGIGDGQLFHTRQTLHELG